MRVRLQRLRTIVLKRRAGWLAGGAVLALALALPPLLVTTHVWPPGMMIGGCPKDDYGIFAWNLHFMTEAILKGRDPFFAAGLYYPLGARLTKHSYAVGFAPVGVATKLLTGNSPIYPIYAMSIARHVSLALGLVLAYAALRVLGAGVIASLAAAVGWTYSVFFSQHIVHLHLLPGVFILPAVTLSAAVLVKRPCVCRAALVAAVIGLGVYFSEYSVFAVLAMGFAVLLALLGRASRTCLRRVFRGVGLRGLAWSALVFMLLVSPWMRSWARDPGKAARTRAIYNWRARPIGFVVPDPLQTPFYRWPGAPFELGEWERCYRYEALVFLGFPVMLLAFVGGVRLGWPRLIFGGLSAVFLVFSLGPFARIGGALLPLPYALVMRVPPFPWLRTPNRLAAVALWSLCCLAALGLTWLMRALSQRGWRRMAVGTAVFAVLWSLAEGRRPGPAVVQPVIPSELALLASGPVVNVPISSMDGLAMYLQVWHGRPILTGYVSRRSPEQTLHVRRLQSALADGSAAFAQALGAFGTRNVILGSNADEGLMRELTAQGLTVIDLRSCSGGMSEHGQHSP